MMMLVCCKLLKIHSTMSVQSTAVLTVQGYTDREWTECVCGGGGSVCVCVCVCVWGGGG